MMIGANRVTVPVAAGASAHEKGAAHEQKLTHDK